MNLIKKYKTELKERQQQLKELKKDGHSTSFIEGMIAQLKVSIDDIQKVAMSDRFFLEEILLDMSNDGDKNKLLVRDFLAEYVSNIPLSETSRRKYIKNVLGNPVEYYFKSEMELIFYLETFRLPSKSDIRSKRINNIIK